MDAAGSAGFEQRRDLSTSSLMDDRTRVSDNSLTGV